MQRITPFLWFDTSAEEAVHFYTSLFPNSKVSTVRRYPEGPLQGPMAGLEGKVLTAIFTVDGYQLMALDGGPYFTFSPSTSLSVQLKTISEIDALYATLMEGGTALMPLGVYGFSKKYAWLNDKYGLSWQINVPFDAEKITYTFAPFLMFHGKNNGKAEEAMQHYISVFGEGIIDGIYRYGARNHAGKEGTVNHADFQLLGQQFMAMDSGIDHKFEPTGAMSFLVHCDTQEEIDRYWSGLSAVPEAEQCGWLKDKYGFSWQIVGTQIGEYMSDPDKAKGERVMQAVLKMKKIILADIERAAEG
jgi:predicted 3-demethylubiquinone-9 3-methyltransferase (glyoxalase superfamily)